MAEEKKKYRNVELFEPSTELKGKVGSGGLDKRVLDRAQERMDRNDTDFTGVAKPFLDLLDTALADVKAGKKEGEEAIELLAYPTVQLKSQGAMFKYKLISDISDIIVNFLDEIKTMNKDAASILELYTLTIKTVLKNNLKDDGGPIGKELTKELTEACKRHHKAHPSDRS